MPPNYLEKPQAQSVFTNWFSFVKRLLTAWPWYLHETTRLNLFLTPHFHKSIYYNVTLRQIPLFSKYTLNSLAFCWSQVTSIVKVYIINSKNTSEISFTDSMVGFNLEFIKLNSLIKSWVGVHYTQESCISEKQKRIIFEIWSNRYVRFNRISNLIWENLSFN